MKEQFVTYPIAKELKELGFKEECLLDICGGETIFINGNYTNENDDLGDYEFPKLKIDLFDDNYEIKIPLWQQVIDWFRNEHNLHIWISCTPMLNSYSFHYNHNNEIVDNNVKYVELEMAREQAILKAIEIIKEKKS